MQTRAWLDAFDDPDLLTMDGFDDCVLGVCERFGQPRIVAYDLDRVIRKLQTMGMTNEEAWEWWSFNQIGAWVGDHTPCFIRRTPRNGGNT